MRGRAWLVGGLLMILMAVALVALITTGARWLLNTGQDHGPPRRRRVVRSRQR